MATQIGPVYQCPKCGHDVVKALSNAGKTYVANMEIWIGNEFLAKRWIPTGHNCHPQEVENWQKLVQSRLDLGQIVKGQSVLVKSGRKVPKGTTGVVFWVQDERVGFKDSDDNVFWIDIKHLVASPSKGEK